MIDLDRLEQRVIGVLIEKQLTVPETYPLTLNALVAGCNQKTSRHPVMELSDAQVQSALEALKQRTLVMESYGASGRVLRYAHNLPKWLNVGTTAATVLAVLMLRGPQTPGELRTHAARLAPFGDVSEVETELEDLMTRPDGPFVVKLQREPGRRESRYMHLFGGESTELAADDQVLDEPAAETATAVARPVERIAALESAVAELRTEIESLKARLDPARQG